MKMAELLSLKCFLACLEYWFKPYLFENYINVFYKCVIYRVHGIGSEAC